MWKEQARCTREGIIGVEDVNLLPAISVDVTRRHPDGVALAVSQGIEWGAAVVNGDVDEPFLLLVVFQHQVWAVVAVGVKREGYSLKTGGGACFTHAHKHATIKGLSFAPTVSIVTQSGILLSLII